MPVRYWNPPPPEPSRPPVPPPAVTPPPPPAAPLSPVPRLAHQPSGHAVGFAREDSQRAALTAAGCMQVFPTIAACLDHVTAGDMLAVTSLEDTMRSVHELLALTRRLAARGAVLVSLAEHEDAGFPALACIAALEEKLRLRASRAGAGKARAQGRTGRPPYALPVRQARKAAAMREQGQPMTAIARHFGVSRDAVYSALARLEAGETWKGGRRRSAGQ